MKAKVAPFARSGFTLMEMMLVLAIIALIVGVAVNAIKGAQQQADISAAQIKVANFGAKLTGFKTAALRFPTQAEGLEALAKKPTGLKKPWVQSLHENDLIDPWNEPYQYRAPAKRSLEPYDVFSKGPDKQEGTDDDIGNWR